MHIQSRSRRVANRSRLSTYCTAIRLVNPRHVMLVALLASATRVDSDFEIIVIVEGNGVTVRGGLKAEGLPKTKTETA